MSTLPLGLVLCGGESRRMGQDKWNLRIYGTTWAEYIASLLAPYCEQVLFSAPKVLDIKEAEFVLDEFPGEGPLGGWYSFAKQHPNRNLYTLPVDMPLLTAASVELLVGEKSGYLCGQEEFAPLAAFLRSEDLTVLVDEFDNGLRSAFTFWEKIEQQKRVGASDRELRNINIASDLPNKR